MFADVNWYAYGFLCPPALSAAQRRKLNETWYAKAPIGLHSLAAATFLDQEAPEMVGLASDFLKWLVNGPSEAITAGARMPLSDSRKNQIIKDVAEHFEKVLSSMAVWQRCPEDLALLRLSISRDLLREGVNLLDLIAYHRFAECLTVDSGRITLALVEFSDLACLWDFLNYQRSFGLGSQKDATRELVKDMHSGIWTRMRAHVWETIQTESIPAFWPFSGPHAGDALFEPSGYFPEGSKERSALEAALENPGGLLSTSVDYVWLRLKDWLPRWDPGNGRHDLNTNAEYWAMLWHAFRNHASKQDVSEISEIILATQNLPTGLNAVRDECRGGV
jgi:hypothetical protein